MNDVSGQQNNVIRVDKGTQTNIELSDTLSMGMLEMISIVKELHSQFKNGKALYLEIKKEILDSFSSSDQEEDQGYINLGERAGQSQVRDVKQPASDPNMVSIFLRGTNYFISLYTDWPDFVEVSLILGINIWFSNPLKCSMKGWCVKKA